MIVIGGALVAVTIVFVGSLGQVAPGNPLIAIAIGVMVLLSGIWAFRAIARSRGPEERTEPEDVADLEVFFVCGECGTEFRVERLGELQVPRHCGERMLVERRPRGVGAG